MDTRSIPIDGPLDLRATLRPLHGRFSDDGWWMAPRTPEGPGSLRVRRTKDEVVGDAWGDGAGWLLSHLARITGLEDDPEEFRTDHPLVSELHRRHPGLRFGAIGLVFDALLVAICGQKVTGAEASAAMSGLYRAFSDPAPGPKRGLRLTPDPERMAETPYWAYHELHLEKRRAELLRQVAMDHVRIATLIERTPADAARALRAIKGVGEWTVAKTLAVSHGDADQVEAGDFHVKHIVVHHLTGKDRGTDAEMLELLEPFRPHRGRVVRLLHTLGHEPSFGPRLTPRDITRL